MHFIVADIKEEGKKIFCEMTECEKKQMETRLSCLN